MKADQLLRASRLAKRIRLLSSIPSGSVDRRQSEELMLMIMECAEELDRISETALDEIRNPLKHSKGD